jgi:hypothetical protein
LQRHHPTKSNPNSFLFKRRDPRSHSNTPIKSSTLSVRYWLLKNKSFPKVLENAELSSEDKEKVRRLLQKPCNPYVRRHTALSEKVRSSKINEYNLCKHAGWSKNSKMLDVYTHDLGDSSSDAVLESWGIVTKDNNFQAKPRLVSCICGTPNHHDSKYCINSNCNRVSYEGYNEMEEEKRQKDNEVRVLRENFQKEMKEMRGDMNKIMSMIRPASMGEW